MHDHGELHLCLPGPAGDGVSGRWGVLGTAGGIGGGIRRHLEQLAGDAAAGENVFCITGGGSFCRMRLELLDAVGVSYAGAFPEGTELEPLEGM